MTPAILSAAQAAIAALTAQAARRRAALALADDPRHLTSEERRALDKGRAAIVSTLAELMREDENTDAPTSAYLLADLIPHEDTAHLEVAARHLAEWIAPPAPREPGDVCASRRATWLGYSHSARGTIETWARGRGWWFGGPRLIPCDLGCKALAGEPCAGGEA